MPNYDYQCTHCNHEEEIFQKMTDKPLTDCPQCLRSSFKRKFGCGIGLQFQGSGFYSTDYAQHSSKSPETAPDKTSSPPSPKAGCGCGKSSCKS